MTALTNFNGLILHVFALSVALEIRLRTVHSSSLTISAALTCAASIMSVATFMDLQVAKHTLKLLIVLLDRHDGM